MTQINQIYKCSICGNVVEILHTGAGQLVCCGQPMELLVVKNQDVGLEKHLPVIEKTESEVIVTVGSVPHPMEESHFIEWIEIIADNKSYKQFLKPGSEPGVVFKVNAANIIVRSYCNIHGLWQSEYK